MLNDGISNSLKVGVQNQFPVPLVQKRMGCIWKEPFQIQQQHSTFPAITPVMPSKLLFDPFELPMKALSLLACPVVIDHGR